MESGPATVEEIDYEGLATDSLAINMLAGSLAGISEHAVMFPVDSIKVSTISILPIERVTALSSSQRFFFTLQTRMQVLTTSPTAVYANMSDAFARISSTEGTRRLWRGVASVILGAGPAHAVYFGMYELAKDMAGGNEGGYSFVATGEYHVFLNLTIPLMLTLFPRQCSRSWCPRYYHFRRTNEPFRW